MGFRYRGGARIRMLVGDPQEPSRNNADDLPEGRLWRQILTRAILDAASRSSALRLEIAQWMTSPDFDTVCDLVDANADFIFERLREILLAKWPVSWILAMRLREVILKGDPDLDVR